MASAEERAWFGRTDMTERLTSRSWCSLPFAGSLPAELVAPVREIARAMAGRAPDQDMLSGIHNPFGHHACTAQAWAFLDIAENPELLDRVADVIGPDIILWDSELYFDLSSLAPDEGACWPVDPLAGTIAVISLERSDFGLIDIGNLAESLPDIAERPGAHLVVRYMPASSHFNRDPSFPPNKVATEARPLVNYTKRPIWLVRGEDHAHNDFVTGFMVPAARWTGVGRDDGATREDNRRELVEKLRS